MTEIDGNCWLREYQRRLSAASPTPTVAILKTGESGDLLYRR
jgi:hypothetical protein